MTFGDFLNQHFFGICLMIVILTVLIGFSHESNVQRRLDAQRKREK